jgi:hypothetical protein
MKGERCKMILDITGVPDAPPIDLFLQESRAEKNYKKRIFGAHRAKTGPKHGADESEKVQ